MDDEQGEIESLRERLATLQKEVEYQKKGNEELDEIAEVADDWMTKYKLRVKECKDLRERLAKAEGERYAIKPDYDNCEKLLSRWGVPTADEHSQIVLSLYGRIALMSRNWDKERDELKHRLLAAETAAAQAHGNSDGYIHLLADIEKLKQEAEEHRARYYEYAGRKGYGGQTDDYWRGRRDEAGYFRDKFSAAATAPQGGRE
jgi:hypothetical protein